MLPRRLDNAALTPSGSSSAGQEQRVSRAMCCGELSRTHVDFVSFIKQRKMQLLVMMLDPTAV